MKLVAEFKLAQMDKKDLRSVQPFFIKANNDKTTGFFSMLMEPWSSRRPCQMNL